MISTADSKSSDLFRQAMGAFETALRTGVKLQEDSVRRCVEILRDVGSPLEWEHTVPAKVTKAVTTMQQNVDEAIGFMNENAQQTVKLMETALQMHQATSSSSEEDNYFWNCALNAMKTNAQIMRQANASVMESWGELAKEVVQRMDAMREEMRRVTEMRIHQV